MLDFQKTTSELRFNLIIKIRILILTMCGLIYEAHNQYNKSQFFLEHIVSNEFKH